MKSVCCRIVILWNVYTFDILCVLFQNFAWSLYEAEEVFINESRTSNSVSFLILVPPKVVPVSVHRVAVDANSMDGLEVSNNDKVTANPAGEPTVQLSRLAENLTRAAAVTDLHLKLLEAGAGTNSVKGGPGNFLILFLAITPSIPHQM